MDKQQVDKQQLRQEKLRLRRELPPAERQHADASLRSLLETLPEYREASVIAAYASDGTEPDLLPLLRKAREAGKTICFPRWCNDASCYEMAVADTDFTLAEGKWKMPEPPASQPAIPVSELERALWLVPGVAFDENCGRLGRGKGIYDRFLAGITGLTVGIFYECQKSPVLPMEPHDRPLDAVVTEMQICRRKKSEHKEKRL